MMFFGIVIFIIGLYLVLTHKNNTASGLYFCHKEDGALSILKERYARGEITTDEFNTMKNVLANN